MLKDFDTIFRLFGIKYILYYGGEKRGWGDGPMPGAEVIASVIADVGRSVADWGRKRAGRGASRAGVIHEGELMDASSVAEPEPTTQSCSFERRTRMSAAGPC